MSNTRHRKMAAVPKQVEGATPRDPSAELLACLDILGEYVDSTPDDDPDLYNSEFLTACWQTIELASALLREHEEMAHLMNEFIAANAEARNATKLVIAHAGEERKYIR